MFFIKFDKQVNSNIYIIVLNIDIVNIILIHVLNNTLYSNIHSRIYLLY